VPRATYRLRSPREIYFGAILHLYVHQNSLQQVSTLSTFRKTSLPAALNTPLAFSSKSFSSTSFSFFFFILFSLSLPLRSSFLIYCFPLFYSPLYLLHTELFSPSLSASPLCDLHPHPPISLVRTFCDVRGTGFVPECGLLSRNRVPSVTRRGIHRPRSSGFLCHTRKS
jgi:hypothetical protein